MPTLLRYLTKEQHSGRSRYIALLKAISSIRVKPAEHLKMLRYSSVDFWQSNTLAIATGMRLWLEDYFHRKGWFQDYWQKQGYSQAYVYLQPSWDSAYQNWFPLWRAFHHCVDYSRKRNAHRRQTSFKQLDLPGKSAFHFSKETRRSLLQQDPATISTIRWGPDRLPHQHKLFLLNRCNKSRLSSLHVT